MNAYIHTYMHILGTPPVNILKVPSTCQEVFETPTVDMLKKDETLTVDMPKTVIRQHAKTGPCLKR